MHDDDAPICKFFRHFFGSAGPTGRLGRPKVSANLLDIRGLQSRSTRLRDDVAADVHLFDLQANTRKRSGHHVGDSDARISAFLPAPIATGIGILTVK